MDISIRLARPADALAMAEIYSLSWEAAYKNIIPPEYIRRKNLTNPALFQRIITDDNNRQYIIECNGKAVGIMCVDVPQENTVAIINDNGIDDSFYELHGIYLHPDHYRKGIGTVALDFAFKKAREAGKCNMIVWVFEENIGSISFYQNCGFHADGARKIYDCGKKWNALE